MVSPILKGFVIGPIGDRDADEGSEARIAYEQGVQILEDVILPACNGFGIDVDRADKIAKAGEIPDQVFRHLRDSPLVIADLTGANPNVMYELGLRHTTGKLTIQLGERGRLPFDVSVIRTIMFKRTDAGLVQARKDLSKSLAASLDSGGDPVTATRIWFEPPAVSERISPSPDSLPDTAAATQNEEEDGPGFLEMLADMEDGTQSLGQTLTVAASIVEDISRLYSDATAQVHKADARGGGAAARLAIANRTAALLDEPASRLEIAAGDYDTTVQRIEPGIEYLLTRLAEEPDQLAEVPDFPRSVRALVDAAGENVTSVLALGQSSIDVGRASSSLKRIGWRLATSFRNLADVSQRVSGWGKWLDRLPIKLDESSPK